MAVIEDIQTLKLVRREFCKRQIDTTSAIIQVFKGVVHVRGVVRTLGSKSVDPATEMNHIVRGLRNNSTIRDVVFEARLAH